VNLDIGPPERAEHRWQTLQSLAPVLTAVFADSPVREGRPTGDRSHRSVIWQHTDPSRTGIVRGGTKEDYLRFALDAQVLVVRTGSDDWRAPDPGFRFRDWLETGWEGCFPEEADWRYHLTTLFPEIRPRGTFEVRCIDGQALPWWDVPVLLLAGLFDGGGVEERLRALLEEQASRWEDVGEVLAEAARMGPAAPLLGDLPIQVMKLGREGIGRLGEGAVTAAQETLFAAFLERYTARGRCPADDSQGLLLTPSDGQRSP
jgi:glutamate--cysteine ligase